MLERALDVVNATIALGVFVFGLRALSRFTLALQRRAIRLFLLAVVAFAASEVLTVVNFFLDWESIDFMKEAAETTFVVGLAAAVYWLYQSEREETTVLRESADTDALTHLHNASYLRRVAGRRVEQALKVPLPLTLIMLDIDDFKAYNDAFGHEAGNVVLQRVAHVMREAVRATDLTARYGGEEFVVFMINGLEAAIVAAEHIRQQVETLCHPLHDPTLQRPITVSLGVAAFEPPMQTLEQFIEAADQGMYRAKQAGKNRVVVSRGVVEPSADTGATNA